MGGALTTSVTLPLVGIATAATAMATSMNADMANVAALGLVPERVLELKANVQDMAISVGKSTSDLADGLYQVVSAFGDTSDTATILEINAKAAAAGLATTTDAINLTSAVTKGYGDTSAEAVQKVADLAFTTVKLGQTDFPALAGAMGKVVPLANEMGVSQEEMFAVMATGTGVTGTASEVVTQMRGTLQSLMAPTGDMTKLIAEQGFASGKAMLASLGYKGTMDAIIKAAEASGTPLAKYMGSIEGQTLALALAGSQSDVYEEKLLAMAEASGEADAAFDAQTKGINASGFAMQQAAIKGQVLMQKLGDGLAPALSKVMDIATPWIDKLIEMVDWFANADESTQTWIVAIIGLVAAIGPVLSIVGTLVGVISSAIGVVTAIAGAMSGLGVVLGVLTGPIGLIVLAVAGLALAWANDFMGIRTKTQEFWDWLTASTSNTFANVQSHWQTHGQHMTNIGNNTWDNVKNIVQMQMTAISGIVRAGSQFMQGDFQGGMQTLSSTAESMWGNIRNIFNNQLDNIRNLFAFFGWADVGESIASGIANGLRNGAKWIIDAAKNAAKAALDTAKSWLGIGSPSKVAAKEIGEPFSEGIGVGVNKAMASAGKQIQGALDGLMGDVAPGSGVAGGAGINIVINLSGHADYEDGRQVGAGVIAELHARGLA